MLEFLTTLTVPAALIIVVAMIIGGVLFLPTLTILLVAAFLIVGGALFAAFYVVAVLWVFVIWAFLWIRKKLRRKK